MVGIHAVMSIVGYVNFNGWQIWFENAYKSLFGTVFWGEFEHCTCS